MNPTSQNGPANVDFGPSLLRETEIGVRLIRTFRDTGTQTLQTTGTQRFSTWVYVAARLAIAMDRFSEGEALALHEREIATAQNKEPLAAVNDRYPPTLVAAPAKDSEVSA